MRRTIPILGALALAAGAALLPAVTPPAGAAPDGTIVELPVAFEVNNHNHSSVQCPADGKDYTVKGHIVAPAAALDGAKAATLYLHAVTFGEYYWRFKGVPGYDYASIMAGHGHVSVTIDRLGYGSSPRPEGNAGTCFGSEADVAHQIVEQLKSGKYGLEGHDPVAFKKVFTAGSSVGGMVAHIEAYNTNSTDGILNFGWGDHNISQYAFEEYNDLMKRCFEGGDPGTPGYAAFARNSRDRFYFHSAPPEVRKAVPAPNPDPCGQARSIPPGIFNDEVNLARIDVPVLLVFGDKDAIFSPDAARQQASRYFGSPEVTLEMIPDTSHFPILEATLPTTVAAVDKWLDRHS
ncbi:MAG TPA: alpha/beta hydrolase [Acidimicrobiia bacterium]|nr:alpha/beta hydrolase [Acidimicrobiia bacterium]